MCNLIIFFNRYFNFFKLITRLRFFFFFFSLKGESIILEVTLLKTFILINKKEKEKKTERLLTFYEEHGI